MKKGTPNTSVLDFRGHEMSNKELKEQLGYHICGLAFKLNYTTDVREVKPYPVGYQGEKDTIRMYPLEFLTLIFNDDKETLKPEYANYTNKTKPSIR